MSNVLEALVGIQSELKAPKDQKANRYTYRNIEDINEAVKPLAAARGCAVVYSDRFQDGLCISTCTLMGEDGKISAEGVSMVNETPQHMSIEQSSGAASSYARKYAAQGLFAIDSSENDPDRVQPGPPRAAQGASGPKAALWAALGRDKAMSDALMGSEHPEDDEYYRAALEQWKAIANYAAEHNGDPRQLAEGCRKRSDYEATPEWCLKIAQEFKQA